MSVRELGPAAVSLSPAKGAFGVSGGLLLRLAITPQGQAGALTITSQRPVEASRILIGKPIEAALKVIPMLFSLCGHAQGIAARRAVEGALGQEPPAEEARHRDVVLAAEAAQELVVPMVMDWPRTGDGREVDAVGNPLSHSDRGLPVARAVRAAVARIVTRALGASGALATDELIAALAASEPELRAVLAAAQDAEQRMSSLGGIVSMPARPAPAWTAQHAAALFDDPTAGELPRFPLWRDAPAEMGPYASAQAGGAVGRGGLADRTQARLEELAALRTFLRTLQPTGRWGQGEATTSFGERAVANTSGAGEAWGVGIAETARGLLIHRVKVAHGLVTDWTIVAPTEWTCHPNGVLRQAVTQWVAALGSAGVTGKGANFCSGLDQETLRWGVHWLIRVLDPCVPYALVFDGADPCCNPGMEAYHYA